MTVMMPRQTWNDERLDHFEKRVDERFDRVDERFELVDERFDRIEADIREMRSDLKQMQRTMVQGVIAICTTMSAGFVAILCALIGAGAF
jgi:hypothetical protein